MEGDEERMAWESKKGIITVARLQIYVELIPWTTAALVTIRQVGTDVFTAMIHHSTHILSFTCLAIRVEGETFPALAPVRGRAAHTDMLALMVHHITHL